MLTQLSGTNDIFSANIQSKRQNCCSYKYICHSHDITLTSNDDKVYLKFENPDFFFYFVLDV